MGSPNGCERLLKSDATDLLFAVETALGGEQFVSNRVKKN